jgi:hypothetical protein
MPPQEKLRKAKSKIKFGTKTLEMFSKVILAPGKISGNYLYNERGIRSFWVWNYGASGA